MYLKVEMTDKKRNVASAACYLKILHSLKGNENEMFRDFCKHWFGVMRQKTLIMTWRGQPIANSVNAELERHANSFVLVNVDKQGNQVSYTEVGFPATTKFLAEVCGETGLAEFCSEFWSRVFKRLSSELLAKYHDSDFLSSEVILATDQTRASS